jgi:hypothetical protein
MPVIDIELHARLGYSITGMICTYAARRAW